MKPCLRSPEELMTADRLGSFHSSFLSFSRSLIRTMICQKWRITPYKFELDKVGIGEAIYKIQTATAEYYAVFFSNDLAPELRNDRVIAESWDIAFCLWSGKITSDDVKELSKNLPLQEKGRYNTNVFCISRANKSLRLFEYIADCLSKGEQPDIQKIKKTGYLVRTTAVYGNGKFGMADYLKLKEGDFAACFRVQMLTVYIARIFTVELVEHIAKNRNPQKAVKLSPKIQQFIGIGNSTGLGMAPFLIKHPQVIDSWVRQREQALYEIIYNEKTSKIENYKKYIHKAQLFFSDFQVPDKNQQQKNDSIVLGLKKIFPQLKKQTSNKEIWQWLQNHNPETQELFLNIFLESYPEISQKYDKFPFVIKEQDRLTAPEWDAPINERRIKEPLSCKSIAHLIEKNYAWAVKIDFTKPQNQYIFWYRSEEKEEPRIGQRHQEEGEEKEMKIDIARSVQKLYRALIALPDEKKNQTISEFLLFSPEFSAEIKRVLNYSKQPYGEIRSNILAKNFHPIDILRLKLSFFGAVKFDPKSDKWLRITLFQGAPLLSKDGFVEKNDDWFLYV